MGKHKRRMAHDRAASQASGWKRAWTGYAVAAVVTIGVSVLVYFGRPGGLGTGRSDASHVLHMIDAAPRVRAAYRIASQIPATLNQLYCWCGCHQHSGHRSNLACFESDHGAECDICIATAEIAWRLVQQGITDPAAIQRVVDAELGPPGGSSG